MLKTTRRTFIGATAVALASTDAEKAQRTQWMAGRWGIMCHWIAPGPAPEKGERLQNLDRAVDAFQVDRLLSQVEESGAAYLIFTIGQNTACYASPNATLDRLAGPGHCSKRDLVLEIARGLHRRGKRFIAYLPAEIKAPEVLHKPFAWNPADQSEFERRYTAFVSEYSVRFGKQLDAWWFDGCYTWPDFHNDRRHWQLWLDAARAGNPQAPVAFNDGSLYIGTRTPTTPLEDYLSGECWGFRDGKILLGHEEGKLTSFLPSSRFLPDTQIQFHVLTPIDCGGDWAHEKPGPMPPPRYTDDELFPVVRHVTSTQGTVTLNVGIYQEGYISAGTLAQLKRLEKALA